MKTIEVIVKDFIVGEIFSEFPTDLNTHPYDFFMMSGVDATDNVGETALREEWGYEVCEEYAWENIRNLRGLMQSKFNDQMRLQQKIYDNCMVRISVFKSELSDEEYEDLKNKSTVNINREGTNDEFLTFKTIRLGGVL